MPNPLLAARELALRYRRGAPPVFSGGDLAVRPREIVALVGESGCGKSSLLSLCRAERALVRRHPFSRHAGAPRAG